MSALEPLLGSLLKPIPRALNAPGVGGGSFVPADLFAGSEQGDHWDAFDTANLFQLSGGTTAVTASGDPVGWMRGQVNGNHFIQATSAQRPVYRPGYLEFLAANSRHMIVSASTALFKFLHDGTGGTILLAAKIGSVADPNTIYGLISTCAASGANVGMYLTYDDRASSSRNDSIGYFFANGSGVAILSGNANDKIPANTNVVIALTFASASSPDFRATVGGVEAVTGNASGAPSTASSTNNLTLGGLGGGGNSSATMSFYAALAISRVLSDEEVAQWAAYVDANL